MKKVFFATMVGLLLVGKIAAKYLFSNFDELHENKSASKHLRASAVSAKSLARNKGRRIDFAPHAGSFSSFFAPENSIIQSAPGLGFEPFGLCLMPNESAAFLTVKNSDEIFWLPLQGDEDEISLSTPSGGAVDTGKSSSCAVSADGTQLIHGWSDGTLRSFDLTSSVDTVIGTSVLPFSHLVIDDTNGWIYTVQNGDLVRFPLPGSPADTGAVTPPGGHVVLQSQPLMALTRDSGTGFLFFSTFDGATSQFYSFDVDTQTATPLSNVQGKVTSMAMMPTKGILFYQMEGIFNIMQYNAYSPSKDADSANVVSPLGGDPAVSGSKDGLGSYWLMGDLYTTAASPSGAGVLYMVDALSGPRRVILGQSTAATADPGYYGPLLASNAHYYAEGGASYKPLKSYQYEIGFNGVQILQYRPNGSLSARIGTVKTRVNPSSGEAELYVEGGDLCKNGKARGGTLRFLAGPIDVATVDELTRCEYAITVISG